MKNSKGEDKVRGTVWAFIRYVTLNVSGMIGLSCYILADTYFVSKALGTRGLAALNLAISIYSVINATGLCWESAAPRGILSSGIRTISRREAGCFQRR